MDTNIHEFSEAINAVASAVLSGLHLWICAEDGALYGPSARQWMCVSFAIQPETTEV